VVGLVALAAHFPSVSNGFAWDDERDIRDNPAVVEAEGPADVLLSPYRGAVPPQRSPYRPVTSLTYWLNWEASPGQAAPFHVVNVALHGVVSALVVVLLGTLGAGGPGALIGGLLFAVHPVHVEAVANVVGRADVLMTLFCLSGALAYLSRGLSAGARAVAVALAYALALGAKENGVVLPALLLVLLWARNSGMDGDDVPLSKTARRRALRTEALVLAPSALVLGGYLALRSHVLGTLVHRDTAPYIAVLGAGERITTATANLAQLARLLLWPADLAADYGPDVVTVVGAGSVAFWAGALVGVLTLVLLVWLFRQERLAAAAVAWAALSVLIVSNLMLPIGIWIAERTLYLPSVGVSLAAAAAVGVLRRRTPSGTSVAWLAGGLLVAAGTWKTLDRIPVWRDSESVLATLAAEHPESYRSQWWLARQLAGVADHAAALRWYEQARQTNPNDLGLALDHARTLLMAGRPGEAEALAASLPPTDPARFVYLAQSKIMSGRSDEAAEDVRQGIERFPADPRLRAQAEELGIAVR
jgi:hypothetical protein